METLVLGIIALVFGLGLRYWINRRKFYRRSSTGAEGFSSYEKSVVISFIERIGKLCLHTTGQKKIKINLKD